MLAMKSAANWSASYSIIFCLKTECWFLVLGFGTFTEYVPFRFRENVGDETPDLGEMPVFKVLRLSKTGDPIGLHIVFALFVLFALIGLFAALLVGEVRLSHGQQKHLALVNRLCSGFCRCPRLRPCRCRSRRSRGTSRPTF